MNARRRLPWLLAARHARARVGRGRLRRRRRRRHGDTPAGDRRDRHGGRGEPSASAWSPTPAVLDDRGFNQFSIAGFERAKERARRRGPRVRLRVGRRLPAEPDGGGRRRARPRRRDRLPHPAVRGGGGDRGDRHQLRRRRPVLRRGAGLRRRGPVAVRPAERRRTPVPVGGGGLPRGIVAADDDEDRDHLHGRRHQDPAGRQLDRRLPAGRHGHEPGHQAPERVLAGLRRRRRSARRSRSTRSPRAPTSSSRSRGSAASARSTPPARKGSTPSAWTPTSRSRATA